MSLDTRIDYNDPKQFDMLLRAVVNRESGGRRDAVGPLITSGANAGDRARGILQVMPKTAMDPGFGIAPANVDDPNDVERVGKEYLKAMLKRYDGRVAPALAGYNAGPGNADRFVNAGMNFNALPKSSETQPYIEAIISQLLSGEGAPSVGQGGETGALAQTVQSMASQPQPQPLPQAAPLPSEQQTVAGLLAGGSSTLADAEYQKGVGNRMAQLGSETRRGMTNTDANASWTQLLGSVLADGVGAYSGRAATDTTNNVNANVSGILAGGELTPEKIAQIAQLNPELGGKLMAMQQNYNLQSQLAGQAQAGRLEVEKLRQANLDPTALEQNAVAAGYVKGTPEYQQFIREQLTKSGGPSLVVSPDGEITYSPSGGVGAGGKISPPAGTGPVGAPAPAPAPVDGAAPVPPTNGSFGAATPAAPVAPSVEPTPEEVAGVVTSVGKTQPGFVQTVTPGQGMAEQIIPGSEADIKNQEREKGLKDEADRLARTKTDQWVKGNIVLNAITDAESKITGWSTGAGRIPAQVFGVLAEDEGAISGSGARELDAALAPIRANVGFDQLNQMRQNSPTGGALGQVTEKELLFLQSTIAALDPGAGAEPLKKQLGLLRNIYRAILTGENYEQVMGFPPPNEAAGGPSNAPSTIGGGPATPPPAAPAPKSREEYEALPSGSTYVDPTGTTRRKP